MNRKFSFQMQSRTAGLVLVFLISTQNMWISGCGEDPESPDNSDKLSMSVECVNGAPEVRIVNDGDAMTDQRICRILYENGTSDSLALQLDAGQSLICTLSNMRGSVELEIEHTSLSGFAGDCLTPVFQEMLETFGEGFDLAALIPSTLGVQNAGMCVYTIYMENIAYATPAAEVTPVNGEITLQIVFQDFTGDIRMESDDLLCPDIFGTMTITSIVYSATVIFYEGSAFLDNADVSINDLNIEIDGVMGFLANWLVDYFESDFATELETEFAFGFNSILEPALSAIIIDEKSCE